MRNPIVRARQRYEHEQRIIRTLAGVCGGTFYNGPEKRYVRCSRCEHVDYEKNEGDRCTGPVRHA